MEKLNLFRMIYIKRYFDMKTIEYKKNIDSQVHMRIKDKHGHFLGKVENGFVYIYCKKCKEFFVLKDVKVIKLK